MMDKFIFYSTLKVSLCLGINSIWRSCFFWIRHWKHFWMKTCKAFSFLFFFLFHVFICQVLDSGYHCPGSGAGSGPGPGRKDSNCVLYFERYGWSYYTCARLLFKNFQGGNQLINIRGYPTQPSRMCSYLETSQQLCHERTELFPVSTSPKLQLP